MPLSSACLLAAVPSLTLPNFYDHARLKDLGIPNEMQYRDMYSEQTGKDLSQDWEFYMVYSLFKVAAICQGILGRVRDGTAASKHAEERGMNVFPLSKGAWSIVCLLYTSDAADDW